jgi:hypothetical protein
MAELAYADRGNRFRRHTSGRSVMVGRMRRRSAIVATIAVTGIWWGLCQQSALADAGLTAGVSSVSGSAVSDVGAAVDATASGAVDVVDSTTEVVSDVGQQAGEIAEAASSTVADAGETVTETVGTVTDGAGQAVSDATGTATSGSASTVTDGAVASGVVGAASNTTGAASGPTVTQLPAGTGTSHATTSEGASDGHHMLDPRVSGGWVQERGGGTLASSVLSRSDARLMEDADPCTGSVLECAVPVALTGGSLGSAVASIIKRLASTGREFLPIVAFALALALMGALALRVAGGSMERAAGVAGGAES